MSTGRSPWRVAFAHLAYNLLLQLACLMALAPWLVRVARDRRQWAWTLGRLGRLPPGRPRGATLWVHAVSVGEVKASRRLVAELRRRAGDATVVLSTGTLSGLQTARRSFPDLYVFPWPLDLPWVTASVLRRIAPRLLLMVELEIWPSLSRQADRDGVPQAIVNARVSASSYRTYRRFCWWLPEFDRIALVAAQTEEYAGRIADLGVPRERIHVTGNLKHDLTEPAAAADVSALAQTLDLGPGPPILVAGSTHDGEEAAVLAAWREAGGASRARLVIVPRHLDRVRDIGRLLRRREVPFVLRSECDGRRDPAAVVLVDSMGELEALFGLADVVFLGGSLVPVGGHNVLEPAAAGCPLLTGPWLETCRVEAEVLQRAGALEVVADAAALAPAVARLLGDGTLRRQRGEAASRATRSLAGATAATLTLLEGLGLPAGPVLDPTGQYATVPASDSSRTDRTGASPP